MAESMLAATTTLPVIQDKPPYCYESGCPLATKGKGFALGTGDPATAKIALILEALGGDEVQFVIAPLEERRFFRTKAECDAEIARRRAAFPELEERFLRRGAPVVGKSGAALNQWILPAAGLRREELFIDNTLRCLPPKKKNAAYPTG